MEITCMMDTVCAVNRIFHLMLKKKGIQSEKGIKNKTKSLFAENRKTYIS